MVHQANMTRRYGTASCSITSDETKCESLGAPSGK